MTLSMKLRMAVISNSAVILYPVDTTVSLSNGEQARVVENKPNAVLRPTVVGLKSGIVYNLSEDLTCASIVIQ